MQSNFDQASCAIELKHMTKAFGDFKANNDINLKIKKGQIHALLGENGAGKSTMMNVLSGLYQPTSGDVFVNGEKVAMTSSKDANNLGIGMVHQHFMLVDDFTVIENIVLGAEPTKAAGILNLKQARQKIMDLSEKYHLEIDPDAKVRDISVGMQQRVEILKLLYRDANILIFDEPTAVLTPSEITELMAIMKEMVQEGKSIILITHKLDEIKEVADECTVIRRGQIIGSVLVKDSSEQQLADMMVGREVNFKTDKTKSKPGEAVLKIENLSVKDSQKVERVKNLSFDVHAGEVLGIAGVDGNGQSELVQAISGLEKSSSGSITLDNKDITNLKVRKVTEAGLGHIPEDRQRFGLILPMTVSENIALQSYYRKPDSSYGVLNYNYMNEHARHLIEQFDIRTYSEKSETGALSGGNQQKVIIAREVERNPKLLIAANPTRGLDVGAIEYIHKRLVDQRDKGNGVLLVSFSLDEILNVSDRILVMHNGENMGIVDASKTSEQELGLMMAGTPLDKIKKSKRKVADK
ncbi:ABC transporter ATP-binding protein [Holzapfeliella sp. JNUCC 72]